MRVTEQAHAKLNLGLDVLEARQDGYHDIETVFCEVDFGDTLTLATSAARGIRLRVNGGEAPAGEENLAWKAVRAVLDATGFTQGLAMTLEKRIPTRAGLGGGSSDAAAALRAAASVTGWAGGLEEAALRLGSDVPFFLNGGLAFGEGRGEALRPVQTPLDLHFLIVCPDCGIETAWAYSELDRLGIAGRSWHARRVASALEAGSFSALAAAVGNDFEAAVLPHSFEVRSLKGRLLEAGAAAAALTGSGAALFGLFRERAEAESAAQGFCDVWCVAASAVKR